MNNELKPTVLMIHKGKEISSLEEVRELIKHGEVEGLSLTDGASDALSLSKEGIKHDQEKPDLSLLPIEFLSEVARAMQHGEKKYGRYNYTNGLAWHRVIAACLRHIYAFTSGEDLDPESGVSHLGHAGACVLMLTVYYKRGLGEDTREKQK